MKIAIRKEVSTSSTRYTQGRENMIKELVRALNAMDDRDPKKRACAEASITQHGAAFHVYWKGNDKRHVYFSVSGLLADAK